MSGMSGWTRGLVVAGAALTVTACASYPTEPRYSTRADQPHAVANVPPTANPYPNAPVYPGQPGQPYPGAVVANEAPPPARAPIESIDGGGLPPVRHHQCHLFQVESHFRRFECLRGLATQDL